MRLRNLGLISLAVLLIAAGAAAGWYWMHPGLPDGIVEANGRLESEQVLVATKFAGRVAEVLVDEGDMVTAGATIARMDARDIDAQLKEAEAQQVAAEHQSDEAMAAIAAREAELRLATQELSRTQRLHKNGYASTELLDQARAKRNTADASLTAARATLRQALAQIDAASATVVRVRSMVDDSILVAPRSGRIQYKLVQTGEVVAAGQAVATLLDLTDVYMTIFLPADAAGDLAIGDEARLVLDPIPQYVIPAKITFVAADAQFTPKSVETSEERAKLMFRVKLTIPRELLSKYESRVKTGIRGVAYVRIRSGTEWPSDLLVKLPDEQR